MVRRRSILKTPMDRNSLSPVVVAAALSACAMEPELLNSERIEQRFGSYGVDVINHDGDTRRSNLYSRENGVRTCRTYAVVQFKNDDGQALSDVHQEVLAGQSIGATFREYGWTIEKRTVQIGSVPSSEVGKAITGLMRIEEHGTLAVHMYELHLERDNDSVHYASIVELHHPEYLGAAELTSIYNAEESEPLSNEDIAALVALLQQER